MVLQVGGHRHVDFQPGAVGARGGGGLLVEDRVAPTLGPEQLAGQRRLRPGDHDELIERPAARDRVRDAVEGHVAEGRRAVAGDRHRADVENRVRAGGDVGRARGPVLENEHLRVARAAGQEVDSGVVQAVVEQRRAERGRRLGHRAAVDAHAGVREDEQGVVERRRREGDAPGQPLGRVRVGGGARAPGSHRRRRRVASRSGRRRPRGSRPIDRAGSRCRAARRRPPRPSRGRPGRGPSRRP